MKNPEIKVQSMERNILHSAFCILHSAFCNLRKVKGTRVFNAPLRSRLLFE
ncbi:MAG: hypothetical protein FWH27_18525 [Planctomycetaceae bacterium]|nr:hypothetical protein [Planctomycetaceae bacterium]